MANLPTNRSITEDQIPGMKEWFRPVLRVMNLALRTLYDALNKNIEFDKNIASQTHEINFSTPSDYVSAGAFPTVRFKKTLKRKAKGVLLLQLHYRFQPTIQMLDIVSGEGINIGNPQWVEADQEIQIFYIGGLEPSTEYFCRVLVI